MVVEVFLGIGFVEYSAYLAIWLVKPLPNGAAFCLVGTITCHGWD
jgi:hypothetical protein